FVHPPETIRTGVYWYWISDNISKEGVIKDLQAMKTAGINSAFIGNIGLSPGEAHTGKVKLFTDEWWDAIHTALKTATDLDIEIGIFNCPGWSQSGGPWVKPEQSMRYLASSEVRVKGPQKFSQKLKQPTAHFQDVKVVAWPVDAKQEENLLENAQIRISPVAGKVNITDGLSELPIAQPETILDINLPEPATARSLVVYPAHRPLSTECELQAKEGNDYRTIRTFSINRTNSTLKVGFEPYAPVAVSFAGTEAKEFRIVFRKAGNNQAVAKIVLSSAPVVERYAEKTLAKMFQTPLPYWHEYMWDKQPEVNDPALMTSPDKVRDISEHLAADGTLTWDVPEGEWVIMRTGLAPTGVTNSPASPEGIGMEVDKMSKEHVAFHFDAFLGEIIRRIPANDRRTWKVVVQDSYETGGQNFTDGMIDEFRARYGYDPVPFLPVYKGHTVGNPDLSDRFLWDIRRLTADKISYDYVGGLREISHKHGLKTWLENYGHWGFPGEFLQYGGQSDEVAGEFWTSGSLGDIECRAASSSAHIYGKTQVWAEAFTSADPAYGAYPANMKRRGDWSFTEGINNTLLTLFIHQPYDNLPPGVNTWFGTEFNRLNTWFSQVDLFTTYIKRCNYMLQQGLNVADVAYFIGEDVPKMTGICDPKLPKGHSFDYINAEVILRDLKVKNGRLILPHGTSYRVLVLPKQETMRPEVLRKIEQLVAEGAVVVGPPPSRSPSMENYPEADKIVKELASGLWGNDPSVKQHTFGKGIVFTNVELDEVFNKLKIVPDCLFGKEDPALYLHRTCNGEEIYFVSNQKDRTIRINPQFRVQGLQPELWDAVSGSIRILPTFEQKDEVTTVPLQLEAFESAFIVFRKSGKSNAAANPEANYFQAEKITEISGQWEVIFETDKFKRGPEKPVIFPELKDWTLHDDEHIRYYSGTAIYKNTFAIKDKNDKEKWYLDLGKVCVMAKVKINGQYAGGVWTPPYRLDITPFLQSGDNTLEIEVVNTWVNRLIGDQYLPAEERPTGAHINPWKVDSKLHPSGLIGPVCLVFNNNKK
ncbi:MAG: glycoside hydrolase family 2, partial [Candidatus Symbiothrix sp.]|nr:glycoside hydrolase family 2 [Candidatus Symbiothrix sp.]